MKIKDLSKDYMEIFFNDMYLKNLDFNNKLKIEEFLRKTIVCLKNKYNILINGIYNVKIYVDSNYGMFLTLKKIDSLFYEDNIDFKVSIIKNNKFYFKTQNYDVINNFKEIYFYNDYFYLFLPSKIDIINITEFGEFVMDSDSLRNNLKRII